MLDIGEIFVILAFLWLVFSYPILAGAIFALVSLWVSVYWLAVNLWGKRKPRRA